MGQADVDFDLEDLEDLKDLVGLEDLESDRSSGSGRSNGGFARTTCKTASNVRHTMSCC